MYTLECDSHVWCCVLGVQATAASTFCDKHGVLIQVIAQARGWVLRKLTASPGKLGITKAQEHAAKHPALIHFVFSEACGIIIRSQPMLQHCVNGRASALGSKRR